MMKILRIVLVASLLIQHGKIYATENERETIDMHLHSGRFESMGPIGQKFILDQIPSFIPLALKRWTLKQVADITMMPYGPFLGIKNQCLSAKLKHCVLFAVYAPKTWGTVSNEDVIAFLDDERNVGKDNRPYFYGFSSVDLDLVKTNPEKAFSNLRDSLKHPQMIGIKMAMVHVMEPMDNIALDPIYQIASETKLPIYHHVGTTPLTSIDDLKDPIARERYRKSFDPAGLERVLELYPKANVILGHMGYDFQKMGNDKVDIVLKIAKKYPNAYLEISAFGHPIYDKTGKTMDDVMTKIHKLGLQSKTIYGSDGPLVPGFVGQYKNIAIASMERSGFTETEIDGVMAGNFRKLVGKKLPK